MSNIYDHAYSLEKAIRDSQEFNSLKELYDVVMNNGASKQLFDDFRNVQFDIQEKQMQGREISETELEEVKQIVARVQENEDISKLMDAEQRMNVVINEVSQIIIKPLEELYQQEDDEE